MPAWVLDLGLTVIILLVTYALASEGLWGSALMFFNVLFGSLIAFNCYEFIAAQVPADAPEFVTRFADVFCLVVLFVVSVLILRLITSSVAPNMVRFPPPLFHIGRLLFAFAGATLTAAIILMALYVSPVHKKVFGVWSYNSAPPFGMGIDHKWLGFFQYTTGKIFARYGTGTVDPYREYGRWGNNTRPIRMFDPEGKWLLEHEIARPSGEGFNEKITKDLEGEGAGAAAPAAGQPGAAPPAGPAPTNG